MLLWMDGEGGATQHYPFLQTMPVGCSVLGCVANVEVVEVTPEVQGEVDELVWNRPIGMFM